MGTESSAKHASLAPSLLATLLALAVAAPPPAARAEDAIGRVVNGHTFMPSATVSQPFATTNIGSSLIFGMGSTTGSIQVGDRTFSGTFEYAGIGGRIGYEQSFAGHYSARVEVDDFIYSGINGSSALVIGSTVQVGAGAGLTAAWNLGDSARWGFLLDVNYAPNMALTIASGISSIVNSCSAPGGCVIEPGKVFSTTSATRLLPAAAISWAPSKAVGLTGALTYIHVEYSGSTTGSADGISLAGEVEYDFGATTSVPIGLQALVNWTAPIGSSNLQHVTDLGGGIFYTGRKDLAAGLQVLVRRFAVRPEVDVSWSTALGQIGLRYYFN